MRIPGAVARRFPSYSGDLFSGNETRARAVDVVRRYASSRLCSTVLLPGSLTLTPNPLAWLPVTMQKSA